MGVTAGIFAAVAAGVGIGELAGGLSKAPSVPSLPAAPSMTTAENTATTDQTAERRALLAAGGQTSIAGGSGSGIVLGSDITSLTLVGSS